MAATKGNMTLRMEPELKAQAAQALHAGTIQKQLVEGSAACADQSEQEPQEKRKWWSKLFKG